jgi:hypothetical protein
MTALHAAESAAWRRYRDYVMGRCHYRNSEGRLCTRSITGDEASAGLFLEWKAARVALKGSR